MDNNLMEKIVSLCKRRGFIFPGSEIYGGLANSWDYGPLGVLLKNNIKALWWKMFVTEREDMVGLDSSIIYNPKVWQVSGHLENFTDPLVECKVCHGRFRADHEDILKEHEASHKKAKDIWTEAKNFNLMFKTSIGATEDKTNEAFLRPETAQGIFINFKNVLDSTNKRLPFGIAQIGKAFRNEITPGNFVFRTREFEQMEIEYFIKEKDWQEHFKHWEGEMKRWIKAVGVDEKKVKYHDIPSDELAHYSKKTVDIEFEFPFGLDELYGLAYRTDHDLKAHAKASGEKLEYRDPETNEKFVPHVIEPSLGVERTVLAVLASAYIESAARSGDKEAVHETEITLKLPKAIAPIKAAILPLSRKEELTKPAKEIYKELQKNFMCQYDDTASIGKRYRRQDEIGTPYCITFDFDSLEDKKVTVRDRDTMEQERIEISELLNYLINKLN